MFIGILIEPLANSEKNEISSDTTFYKLREMYGSLIEQIVTALPNTLIISLYEILSEKLIKMSEKINYKDHSIYKLIYEKNVGTDTVATKSSKDDTNKKNLSAKLENVKSDS